MRLLWLAVCGETLRRAERTGAIVFLVRGAKKAEALEGVTLPLITSEEFLLREDADCIIDVEKKLFGEYK